MYKEVLRSMEGVEIYPSISLILFFLFFILLVGYLIKTGKQPWEHAANLPLESDENANLKFEES
jgi:cbb3-type cytochrome oxidase subunit 3